MKNILVTGSNGQLGSELKDISGQQESFNFIFTDVDELNIVDKEEVIGFFSAHQVDAVINCAAYNAVDKAEEEPETAMEVNAKAVENLAQVSASQDIFMVHISTDYVFGGDNSVPYTEEDIPVPQSAYARSKFEGEQRFLQNIKRGGLIRTSWLYSAHGSNFVKTMIRLGKEKKELGVIYDQIGTPTYAKDLAGAVVQLLQNEALQTQKSVYHFSNEGVASWYDFAYQIMQLKHLSCKIKAVTTEEFPLPAKRPHYSLMSKSKIKKELGLEIRHWGAALEECLNKIKS